MSIPDWKIQQNKELGEIFKTNYPNFKRIAATFKGSNEEQEDIVQKTFENILKSNIKIENMKHFIGRAIVNTGYNHQKSPFIKRRMTLSGRFECITTVTAETEMLRLEENILLNKFVDTLSKRQSQAIKLGIMDGLNFNEVGKIMNISRETAKANWRWGILKLRNKIKSWDLPKTHETNLFIVDEEVER